MGPLKQIPHTYLVAVQRTLHQLGNLRKNGSLGGGGAEDVVEAEPLALSPSWTVHLQARDG